MSKIDELNKEIEEKSDIVFRLRNDVVFYEDKINKVKEDLDMVQSKSIIITDDLNKQINSLSKLLKSKQEDYDYLMKNLEMIGSSINLARAELTEIESNIDVSIDKYAESMKEYNLLKSKLDGLESRQGVLFSDIEKGEAYIKILKNEELRLNKLIDELKSNKQAEYRLFDKMILEHQKLIDDSVNIQNRQKIESELYMEETNKKAHQIISNAIMRAEEIKQGAEAIVTDAINDIQDRKLIIDNSNKVLNERIEKANSLMSANDELVAQIKAGKEELFKQEADVIDGFNKLYSEKQEFNAYVERTKKDMSDKASGLESQAKQLEYDKALFNNERKDFLLRTITNNGGNS